MLAVKTKYDGKKIVVPDALHDLTPGEIILVVDDKHSAGNDRQKWMKAQEMTFSKVWDNEEDAIYDNN